MTGVLSSLTNRIFLAMAMLVVISIGVAIYRVTAAVTARAEADLQSGVDDAAALLGDLSRTQFADFLVKASLIADLPTLKAAASTDDPPTVQPIAEDLQRRMGADLFVVLGRTDRVLARSGRVPVDDTTVAALVAACRSSADQTVFTPHADGLVHAAAVPVYSGDHALGTLLVGFNLDRTVIERFKAITASDIVLTAASRVVASTLAHDIAQAVPSLTNSGGTFSGWIGGEEYVGRRQMLSAGQGAGDPAVLVLRSRTEHLRLLPPLRLQIALTGVVAVLVATMLGYGIARTVTRPLRALTASMREIAATGDLGRATPATGRWDDEDARLLSTTFGQLTGALHRFQREAAQRERLSSLGRLSTVIAHEIRNPLMIIKSAVRSLRRNASSDVAAAAQSIDEEVNRLNNVVTGVLDFAKPIRFELDAADLVDICRAAVQAAQAASGTPIQFDTETDRAPVTTDVERIRAVVVNLLSNAQQAVQAASSPQDVIALRLSALRPGWWLIEVRDRGEGISAEDLGRVFEPFFTTRRTGSGLGLAISRNVVEGLGGTITIHSRAGAGTRVRVELPDAPPAGAPLDAGVRG